MNKKESQNEEKKSGRRKYLKVALGAGAAALLLYFFYPEVEKILKKKPIETVTKTITEKVTTPTETITPTSTVTSLTTPTTTASITTVTTPLTTETTTPTATTTATTRTMTIPTRAGTLIPHFPETARRPFLEIDVKRIIMYKSLPPMYVIPIVNRGNGSATAVLDIYKLLLSPGERTVPFPWILTPDKMLRPREVFFLPAWSSKNVIVKMPADIDNLLGIVLALYDPILDPCSFTLTEDTFRNENMLRHYAYIGK
ncbi:MAG: hypothetical protein QXY18_03770 [Nitrososphaerota archaeon]